MMTDINWDTLNFNFMTPRYRSVYDTNNLNYVNIRRRQIIWCIVFYWTTATASTKRLTFVKICRGHIFVHFLAMLSSVYTSSELYSLWSLGRGSKSCFPDIFQVKYLPNKFDYLLVRDSMTYVNISCKDTLFKKPQLLPLKTREFNIHNR